MKYDNNTLKTISLSFQFSSVAHLCPTLCNLMNRSTPGLPVHHHLPEFTQTHVHWVGDAIQPSHPLSSPFPPAPNPSQHQSFPMSQLFTWGGQSTGVSALASFLPKNTQGWSPLEWTGWISLQSKGLLKSLLQHHSSKASILRRSAFFTVQLLHPYMTTGKTIALTRWTFVGKVLSLLFNVLSRLVITFLPRSKHLLISWLQSPSAVILSFTMALIKIKTTLDSDKHYWVKHRIWFMETEVFGEKGEFFFQPCFADINSLSHLIHWHPLRFSTIFLRICDNCQSDLGLTGQISDRTWEKEAERRKKNNVDYNTNLLFSSG